MGQNRLLLQTLLETLMVNPTEGQPPLGKVYFQPKPKKDLALTYPCIQYARDQGKTKFADNQPYTHTKRYQITIIDPSPDSILLERLEGSSLNAVFQRHFATDNLNHDIYSLYY